MEIKIEKNNNNVSISDLITIAKRANNPKRNFLFVSKVLGKHIPVSPDKCKAIGWLLAADMYNNQNVMPRMASIIQGEKPLDTDFVHPVAKDNILIIGFAETATGIGMNVASAIEGCYYQTTTREVAETKNNLFDFEEEHSHATTHHCYITKATLEKYNKIALVDDEITTGKSMLNIIRAIYAVGGHKEYNILSILDWRSKEHKKAYADLEKELGIKIRVVSVISGYVDADSKEVYEDVADPIAILQKNEIRACNIIPRENGMAQYYQNSGRFGVSYDSIQDLENECKSVADVINAKLGHKLNKVLVVGHGEDIYIPTRIANYIDADDVAVKSTTRSPICVDNDLILEKNYFLDNDVKYYFYNQDQCNKEYDVVIFITETGVDVKLCDNCLTFMP